MAKGGGITLSEALDSHNNSYTGKARHPRDTHAVFRDTLGLTSQESDDQWDQIKKSVHEILLHRDLAGSLPSSICNRTKRAIAKQLEAAHPGTFSKLKPTSHRRDLIYRIFAYQMAKLRGRVRRSELGNPQQILSQQEMPSQQETPQAFTPAGSPKTEFLVREFAVATPVVESLAVEQPSAEMLEEAAEEALAPVAVWAESFAVGFPGAESLPAGTWTESPEMVLVPAPAAIGRKEVVVTVLIPSVPSFKTMLIKSHLLEDSKLSMSKFFQILREDGFHCRPEDYVVRDEFGHNLESHRHLTIAFQLLANEERLESHWLVLWKGEEGLPNPGIGAPAPATTPNISGPSGKNLSGEEISPNPSNSVLESFSGAQAVVDSSSGEFYETQDCADTRELQLSNPRHLD